MTSIPSGRSGRHLTTFEMMAHHAFNTPNEEIYWKDRTVELCDQFIASIGGDLNRVTYKENPWIGGGNAGPSVEVLIGGLEIATLVFMSLGRQKTEGPGYELKGEMYYPMKLRIVDTGYGLERLVWASKGSPTIYDAVFPEMVSRVMSAAGLSHMLDNKEYTKLLALNAKFAGLMDISGTNLFNLRKKVAAAIDVSPEKLDKMITPIEKVYAIVDHTRCLAYMLGDCIVPSNVREGYLARLVIRRTLRMMNELKIQEPLADLIEQQTTIIGSGKFEQDIAVVREIVERETEKYASTLERGTRIVQKVAKTYKAKSQRVPLAEVMVLYDSHGIQPEMIKEIAAKEGAVVDLPDNFYSMVADMHSESKKEAEEDKTAKYAERLQALPPTKKLYYDQPSDIEFEAVVLDFFDGYAVLDQTLFYPEGGGQPADTGTLIGSESMAQVDGRGQGRRSDPPPYCRRDPPARGTDQGDGGRGTALVADAPPHRNARPPPCHKGSARGPHPPGRRPERQREFPRRYPALQAHHSRRTPSHRGSGKPHDHGEPAGRDRDRGPDKSRAEIRVLAVPGRGSPGQGYPDRQSSRRYRGLRRHPLPEHRRSRHDQDHPRRAYPGRHRADRVRGRYCSDLLHAAP